MPVCRADMTLFSSYEEMLEYYGVVRSRTNQWGEKGSYMIHRCEKINIVCDVCGELSYRKSKLLGCISGFDVSSRTMCRACKVRATKLKKYGNETFNNTHKRTETFMAKYGNRNGAVRYYGHKVSSSMRLFFKTDRGLLARNNLSILAKERFKDKKNHPFTGRNHTQESKEKNRQSQFSYLDKNGLRAGGTGKYKTGVFTSVKNNNTVRYRSSYEEKFYILLEMCGAVKSFDVEPFGIKYFFEGKERRYYPDVLVNLKSGSKELIEIKPKSLQYTSKNIHKFRSAEKFLETSDIDRFIVLDDVDSLRYVLRKLDNRHDNVSFVKKLMGAIDGSFAGGKVEEGLSGAEIESIMKKAHTAEILDMMADEEKDKAIAKKLSKYSEEISAME